MSSIPLPSSPVYLLNLPDNNTFEANFVYRYYTIDERQDETNSNVYTEESFKSDYGDPRKVVLTFDQVADISIDDEIGRAFSQESVMAEIFSEENIKKLTSELMLQSAGYTKLTSQTPTMQSYITSWGSGDSVNMIEAFFKGASVSSNSRLYSDIAANLVISNQVYLDSSTGFPVTSAGNTVSPLALQNFIATDYIHDIAEASTHNPFSIHGNGLAQNLTSLKSVQVRHCPFFLKLCKPIQVGSLVQFFFISSSVPESSEQQDIVFVAFAAIYIVVA